MRELKVTVRDKIATADGQTVVCGNSDYTVHFDLDAEWDAYETKTMRVVNPDRTYTDVVFTGIEAPLPAVVNQSAIRVGLFAGDLHTSTPAYFPCELSILCGTGSPVDPEPDVYAQIMELLNKDSGVWYPSVQDGVVSWHRSISETEPTPVNIQGPAGPAGATGPAGKDGAQGIQGIQGAQGEKGADGKTPVKGIDYWTEADKSEIVTEVVAALPKYGGTVE